MIEHYKTLGIAPGASKEEIRQAFRRCAMQYHPDRNGSSQESVEKFRQCKAAYDALASGRAGDQHRQPGGGNDLNDIFNAIFRRASAAPPPVDNRGHDVIVQIQVSLLDSIVGRTLELEVPSWQRCVSCATATPVECRKCKGRGHTVSSVGLMSMKNECLACHGLGTMAPTCARCDSGIVQDTTRLKLSVPAGIRPGMRLRVTGAGRPGFAPGAGHGDLFVQVEIAEHPSFKRVDQDLHCQIEVVATVAAVGGLAALEWIDGTTREIVIPPGAGHETMIRIPGAGAPAFSGSSLGDLFCHVRLSMPAGLTARQKRLLEKFNATLD